MKLFTTPALTRDDGFDRAFVTKRDSRYYFCIENTCKIFNLPGNVTKVWFVFYDRVGVDRWLVQEVAEDDAFSLFTIEEALIVVDQTTINVLRHKLGDRSTVYVKCLYETGYV